MKATVNVTGRLGQDAQSKVFENKKGVVEFSVASNSSYINKDGERVENVDWHNIKVYVNEVKDSFVNRLKKGAMVVAKGTLEYDEYKKGEVNIRSAYINVRPGLDNLLILPPSTATEATLEENED